MMICAGLSGNLALLQSVAKIRGRLPCKKFCPKYGPVGSKFVPPMVCSVNSGLCSFASNLPHDDTTPTTTVLELDRSLQPQAADADNKDRPYA